MGTTITLDKHETVIDKDDLDFLLKKQKELELYKKRLLTMLIDTKLSIEHDYNENLDAHEIIKNENWIDCLESLIENHIPNLDKHPENYI